jgi:hypothetical protein
MQTINIEADTIQKLKAKVLKYTVGAILFNGLRKVVEVDTCGGAMVAIRGACKIWNCDETDLKDVHCIPWDRV